MTGLLLELGACLVRGQQQLALSKRIMLSAQDQAKGVRRPITLPKAVIRTVAMSSPILLQPVWLGPRVAPRISVWAGMGRGKTTDLRAAAMLAAEATDFWAAAMLASRGPTTDLRAAAMLASRGQTTDLRAAAMLASRGQTTDLRMEAMLASRGQMTDLRAEAMVASRGKMTDLLAAVASRGQTTDLRIEAMLASRGQMTDLRAEAMVASRGQMTDLRAEAMVASRGKTTDLLAAVASRGKTTEVREAAILPSRGKTTDLRAAAMLAAGWLKVELTTELVSRVSRTVTWTRPGTTMDFGTIQARSPVMIIQVEAEWPHAVSQAIAVVKEVQEEDRLDRRSVLAPAVAAATLPIIWEEIVSEPGRRSHPIRLPVVPTKTAETLSLIHQPRASLGPLVAPRRSVWAKSW